MNDPLADVRKGESLGFTITLPLRIESCANLREHWRKRSARTKMHREAAAKTVIRYPLPIAVTLTRIASRKLDDDNLQGGFKALRDGIADKLGVPDNDPGIEWRYAQEKGKPKEYAARVTFTYRTKPLKRVVL